MFFIYCLLVLCGEEMNKIRIGSRDSQLAIKQTQIVIDAIKKYDNNIDIELVTMKTTGDKRLDVTLDKVGGKGLFIKELDEALIDGRVDLTVHSFKDMPMEIYDTTPIIAVSNRVDPFDVMIFRKDFEYNTVNKSEILVGSSSLRRKIFLNKMGYTNVSPVRGNLQTRLNKLDSGEFDALVLASAGIKRLGLEDRINQYFTKEEMIPAGCQGVICVQAKNDEKLPFLTKILSDFNCQIASVTSTAERAFIEKLEGGCTSPIACYSYIEDDIIYIKGMYVNKQNECFLGDISGDVSKAYELGIELANRLKK